MLHWAQGNLRLPVHINVSERFALKPAHLESMCQETQGQRAGAGTAMVNAAACSLGKRAFKITT